MFLYERHQSEDKLLMGALLRNTCCSVWIPAEGHITVFISERWPQTDTQSSLSSDTQMERGARWATNQARPFTHSYIEKS